MKNRIKNVWLAIVILLITGAANAIDLDLKNYRWTLIEASGEATGRHENAFVEFQNKFYLMAGRGINAVNVLDPLTNSWETKAN